MPAVAVTVKKLVWFHTPFLCKYAQPYIQCVTDFFFKKMGVYVLDCEAGLWRCTHADLPLSCSWLRQTLQWRACAPVGFIFAVSVLLTKRNTHCQAAASVRVTDCVLVVGLFRCLCGCCSSLWHCVSCTWFSCWQDFLTEVLHFVLLAHISCSRPWNCLERVTMLWVHAFPNFYHGGIRTT